MIRVLALLLFLPFAAQAQQQARSIQVGKIYHANIPFCMAEASMREVLNVERDSGIQAAIALLNAKDDCDFEPGVMFEVVAVVDPPVVISATRTLTILEIEVAGHPLRFFTFTALPVGEGT